MESSVAQPIQERFRSRAPMHTARPAERRHRRMISVSFLISTFNRRDILLATLWRLHECGAYPDGFIGCGTGFRRAALDQVGGLPDDFFMQCEEYDRSLRLLDGGWRVRTFADHHVAHLKTPTARASARTTRLDVRNN